MMYKWLSTVKQEDPTSKRKFLFFHFNTPSRPNINMNVWQIQNGRNGARQKDIARLKYKLEKSIFNRLFSSFIFVVVCSPSIQTSKYYKALL